MSKLLSITEVAKLRGVNRTTVHRWLAAVGGLPHVKVGTFRFVEQRAAMSFVPRPCGNPRRKRKIKVSPAPTPTA